MNVMSAFFGAAGIFLIALTIFRLYPGAPFAGVAVLFIAFSPAYWRLSQVSEMYSLNAFLASLIIYIGAQLYPVRECRRLQSAVRINAVRWWCNNDIFFSESPFFSNGVYLKNVMPDGARPAGTVYLLSLLCGISCANHPTIVFVMPGLLWFIISSKTLESKQYLACMLFFTAGIAAYLFLPIRSLAHPVLQWGDLNTIENFLRIVTRADYGGLRLHPDQSKFSWTSAIV